MPDPRDNAQQRGDIHPPEVESDLPSEEGMADMPATEGAPAGRGSRRAGQRKDQDAPATGASGTDAEQGKKSGRG